MKHIDLHSHTIHSDGKCSVSDVLQRAQSCGLAVFSISDHNSVGAYFELEKNRQLFSGRILPAVELSTSYNKEAIEVLGYGIDTNVMAEYIKSNYLTREKGWICELKIIADVLLKKGVVLSDEYIRMLETEDEKLRAAMGGTKDVLLEEIKRHPENAKIFGGKEVLDKIDRHIFHRQWLSNPESPLFSDKTSLTPSLEDTVNAIHNAGGLVFLAHAFLYSPTVTNNLEDISKYLDGLECHYGTFTKEQKEYITAFCDGHNLYKSGGSDFHGEKMRPKNIMGLSCGEKIEYSLCTPWLDNMKLI